MNTEEVKRLIADFYDGKTTVDEENLLIAYFCGDDVAEELLCEKEYFEQLQNIESVVIPSTLAPKMDRLFDDIALAENKKVQGRRKIWLWTSVASAAAMIALVAGYAYLQKNAHDYFISPEVASVIRDTASPVETKMMAQVVDTTSVAVVHSDVVEKAIEQRTMTKVKSKKPKSKKPKTVRAQPQSEQLSEEDYRIMVEALEMVSNNIDKGLSRLSLVSESITQTTEKLNKR